MLKFPGYDYIAVGTLKMFMDDIYIAERNSVEGITGKTLAARLK